MQNHVENMVSMYTTYGVALYELCTQHEYNYISLVWKRCWTVCNWMYICVVNKDEMHRIKFNNMDRAHRWLKKKPLSTVRPSWALALELHWRRLIYQKPSHNFANGFQVWLTKFGKFVTWVHIMNVRWIFCLFAYQANVIFLYST